MTKPSSKAHAHNRTFFAKPTQKKLPDYRTELRERLSADTEAFLASGGEITVCKSKETERGGCSHWGGVL